MELDLSQTQPESMTHRPRTIVVGLTIKFFITVSSFGKKTLALYSLTHRNQFDPTILGSAFGSLVGRHKVSFAEALGNQAI